MAFAVFLLISALAALPGAVPARACVACAQGDAGCPCHPSGGGADGAMCDRCGSIVACPAGKADGTVLPCTTPKPAPTSTTAPPAGTPGGGTTPAPGPTPVVVTPVVTPTVMPDTTLPPHVGNTGGLTERCTPGAPDCKTCAGGGQNSVSCGMPDPFTNAETSSLVNGDSIVTAVSGNNRAAKAYLSSSPTTGGEAPKAGAFNPSTGGAPSGLTQSGLGFGNESSSTNANTGPGAAGGSDGSDNGGVSYQAGAGRLSGQDGGGAADAGVGVGQEGSNNISFDGKAGSGPGAGAAYGTDRFQGSAATAAALDSDNSETWPFLERERRLKKALEMDPDEYLKMIGKEESIFKRVHVRYEKVSRRFPPDAFPDYVPPVKPSLSPSPSPSPSAAPHAKNTRGPS